MSDKLLTSLSFSSFSGDSSYSFILVMFFVSLYWLPLCVCFYVLSRYAMTSSLGRVALCSSCPVGKSGMFSLITWGGYSRNVLPVGYVDPPVLIECWLLLGLLCMGVTLWLADCEDQIWPQCMSCCVGADHTKQNLPQQSLVPAEISLWICCLWN